MVRIRTSSILIHLLNRYCNMKNSFIHLMVLKSNNLQMKIIKVMNNKYVLNILLCIFVYIRIKTDELFFKFIIKFVSSLFFSLYASGLFNFSI